MKKYLPLLFSALFLLFGTVLIILSLPKNQSNSLSINIQTQPQVAAASDTAQPSLSIKNHKLAKVIRVIDGDTIELESGQKVRYIGIDTPETVDPRKTTQCFGQEASSKNKDLVEGEVVSLEKDVSETDKYGRLLRYVYIGDIFVNDYLVEEGYAYASSFPPDVKYQENFQNSQHRAQSNNKGLWSSCREKSPQTIADQGCLIKGNISTSGEKIYHLPGQRYYEKTVIDESRGERWFCTEEEAQNATWRKSKQ